MKSGVIFWTTYWSMSDNERIEPLNYIPFCRFCLASCRTFLDCRDSMKVTPRFTFQISLRCPDLDFILSCINIIAVFYFLLYRSIVQERICQLFSLLPELEVKTEEFEVIWTDRSAQEVGAEICTQLGGKSPDITHSDRQSAQWVAIKFRAYFSRLLFVIRT